MSKAVNRDGSPTRARDENGVLLDLDARDVERMAKRQPGSAARYLEERKKELETLRERERQDDDRRRFEEAFVAAGGDRKDAEAAFKAHRNEQAAAAARTADQEALRASRARIRGLF